MIDITELSLILLSIDSCPFRAVKRFGNGRARGRFFRRLEVGFFVLVRFVGKVLDIDFRGLALSLLDALNQAELLQLVE